MTPFFNPGPNPYGAPKVFLAGVGELMTEVAGEVCDGFLVHGFTTERYLREVTLPALERGLAKAGTHAWPTSRSSCPAFVVTGATEEEMAAAADGAKQQIAFYGSTPAYRGGARAPRLGRPAGRAQRAVQARASGWRWASSSTDEILDAFAVVAEPDEGRRRARRPLRRRDRPAQLLRAVPGRRRGRSAKPCCAGFTGAERVSYDVRRLELGVEVAVRHSERWSLPDDVLGRLPGGHQHDVLGGQAHGVADPVGDGARGRVARSPSLVSATTTMPSLPGCRSTPKAMTLPARTPSTSADRPLDVLGEHVAAADDDHVLDPAAHDQLAVDQVGRGRRCAATRRGRPRRWPRGACSSRG